MHKLTACAGASIAALLAMAPQADAKKVSYEINGQRYSYSTNNREQVQEARRRIEAANAADAARAKAEAERAANPLVAIFGSQAQTEAKEAQSRLQRLVAPRPSAGPAPAPAEARTAERPPARRAASTAADRRPQEPRTRVVDRQDREPPASPPAAAEASVATEGGKSAAGVESDRAGVTAVAKGEVKSVFFDLATGIKTVEMMDGTVHEEPFDVTTASTPGSDAAKRSLNGFVDEVRKAP
jgi:hypothetical protein